MNPLPVVHLGASAYVVGSLATIVTVVVLGAASHRLRRALLPDWQGATAVLAEIVAAVGVVLLVSQLLGSLHAFSRGPVFIALVGASVAMYVVAARLPARSSVAPPIADRATEPRGVLVAAAVAVFVVSTRWFAHTAQAMTVGMTQADTLWYHGPFAARFVQEHSFAHLGQLGYASSRAFPFNAELVHAVLLLPFRRDVFSPLVNLAWMAVVLLAAWSIGRRRSVGGLAVIGAAIVLSLPTLAAIEPGQASNDLPCAALLLAAVALLLRGDLAPVPTAYAALAAAMAVGTKLTAAGIVAGLTIGIVVIAARRRSLSLVVAWCAPLVVGGYWFVRNWVERGNPLPWVGVHLGPVTLSRTLPDEGGTSLRDLATNTRLWRDLYLPGLPEGYGVLWPVIVVLLGLAIVYALVRGRGTERLVGIAIVAGVITYAFTPLTGGPGFVFNLRYLAPTLVIAFSIVPYSVARTSARARTLIAAAGVGLVVLNVAVTPGETLVGWPRGYVADGVLLALAATAVAFGLFFATRASRATRIFASVATALLAVVAGWPILRHYEKHRYVDAGLEQDVAYRYFRGVRNARVAVFGTQTYPMFGLDLSNEVDQRAVPVRVSPTARCRVARADLDGFDYVVLTPIHGFDMSVRPREEWFDGAGTVVARDAATVVYRIDGSLAPGGCP